MQSQQPSSPSTTIAPPPTPVLLLKAFPPDLIGMMMLQVALVILILCAAAIYLGRILDAQFNARPWVSVGLLVMAAVVSLVIIYKLGLRTVAKAERAYSKWQTETKSPETTSAMPTTDMDQSVSTNLNKNLSNDSK
jgi:hypothetical protein